jgi:hypothetical protein
MGDRQRREFHEALLDADSFEDLPGKWQAAILEAEQNRPEAAARESPGPKVIARGVLKRLGIDAGHEGPARAVGYDVRTAPVWHQLAVERIIDPAEAVGPGAPVSPRGPVAPVKPRGPAGSWPGAKSRASSEAFRTSRPRTLLLRMSLLRTVLFFISRLSMEPVASP